MRILSDNRVQSVAISISKLPSVKIIEEALNNYDSNKISNAQISTLLKICITDEEISKYEEMDKNDSTVLLEKEDEFLVNLNKIPNSKMKLGIWKSINEYTDNYEGINKSIEFSKLGTKEINGNKIIKKLLSYVLTVGNILNAGSTKGQADGFSLDSLSKLNSVKDINGKTLLQYVCSQMLKDEAGTANENIKKQFTNLPETSKLVFAELEASVRRLKREIKEQSENVEKLPPNELFTTKTKNLFDKYTKEIEETEKKFNDNLKTIQEMVLFYGYGTGDSKYKNPEEFFTLINDFINEVDRSSIISADKKVIERKHELGKKIVANEKAMEDLLTQLKSRVNP